MYICLLGQFKYMHMCIVYMYPTRCSMYSPTGNHYMYPQHVHVNVCIQYMYSP